MGGYPEALMGTSASLGCQSRFDGLNLRFGVGMVMVLLTSVWIEHFGHEICWKAPGSREPCPCLG